LDRQGASSAVHPSSSSGTDVAFWARSTTSHPQLTTTGQLGGSAAATRRRHGLEVEDEGHLKKFIVIFVFVKVFLYCSFF
jgi:hypothetical protein